MLSAPKGKIALAAHAIGLLMVRALPAARVLLAALGLPAVRAEDSAAVVSNCRS
jgi:hypothetical protein